MAGIGQPSPNAGDTFSAGLGAVFEMIRESMGRLADSVEKMRETMATKDDIAALTRRTDDLVTRREFDDVKKTAETALAAAAFERWKTEHFEPVRAATKESVPWKVILGVGGAIGGAISIAKAAWDAIPHK